MRTGYGIRNRTTASPLSGAGQLMRSRKAQGAVECAFEDARLAYLRGNADASYGVRARRCRRHVLFLKKAACFVLVDEYVSGETGASALEWHAHSWARFDLDEARRRFSLRREDSRLEATLLYQGDGFFRLSEGWEPPPQPDAERSKLWPDQFPPAIQHVESAATRPFRRCAGPRPCAAATGANDHRRREQLRGGPLSTTTVSRCSLAVRRRMRRYWN